MSKSYFINGLIKTNISWNRNIHSKIQQYDIYWIEDQCYSDIYSCCYRHDAVTIQNYFQLYDLRFNCTYSVNINAIVLENCISFVDRYFVDKTLSTDILSIDTSSTADRSTAYLVELILST